MTEERLQQFRAGLLGIGPRQYARERVVRRSDLQRCARRRFGDQPHAAIGDGVARIALARKHAGVSGRPHRPPERMPSQQLSLRAPEGAKSP